MKPFKQIISQVRDIINPNVNLEFGVFDDTSYIDYTQFDIYQLYRDTGYRAKCDFKESILKTAEWVKTLNFKG